MKVYTCIYYNTKLRKSKCIPEKKPGKASPSGNNSGPGSISIMVRERDAAAVSA